MSGEVGAEANHNAWLEAGADPIAMERLQEGFEREGKSPAEARAEAGPRSGGNAKLYEGLRHNGPWDAWRHAEWSRRVAEDFGHPVAGLFGSGHELENLYQWILEDAPSYAAGMPPTPSFWNLLRESWMDLQNNAYGRSQGNQAIRRDDPNLIFYPEGDTSKKRTGRGYLGF